MLSRENSINKGASERIGGQGDSGRGSNEENQNKLNAHLGLRTRNAGVTSHQGTQQVSQRTLQTQSLLVSDSGSSLPVTHNAIHASVEVNKVSIYKCSHGPTHSQNRKVSNIKCGDAHLINCNMCGAYLPKTGSQVIRATKRHCELNKLYVSDILRSMYSQCQQKSAKVELSIKISPSYQEVRNLIIDWLAEVAETLRLDTQKSAYNATILLDRFLSYQIKTQKKEMDQSLIMLQALCCLFIAAKNWEKDPNVPSSRKFLRQLPGYKPTQAEQNHDQHAYQNGLKMLSGKDGEVAGFNSQKNELVSQETTILNHLDFDLDRHPSFFDIIEIFMAQGILFTTDQHFQSPVQDERCVVLIEKYVDFFVLLSLQDHKLVNTNQYLIACSIVSAARKQCNINPSWPPELELLTGLQLSHFSNIEKRLIQKFDQQYNAKNKIKGKQSATAQLKQTQGSDIKKKYGSQERDQNQTAPTLNNQIKSEEAPRLSNQQPQDKPQLQVQSSTNSTSASANNHQRDVSKSNLLGRHQESSLFRNMVQENKQKYDQIVQNEKSGGDTLENRQQQMRIKYGSNKLKQKEYQSRMDPNGRHGSQGNGGQFMAISAEQPKSIRKMPTKQSESRGLQRTASQTSMQSSQSQGSNSNIIRLKHKEYQHSQQKSTVNRQKSLVIGTTSESNAIEKANNLIQQKASQGQRQFAIGSSSTKAADRTSFNQPKGSLITNSGTQQKHVTGSIPKQGGKQQMLYSRELSNAKFQINGQRGSSQTSTGSVGGFTNKLLNHQSTDNKSLVRQALKNQKRTQKINPDNQNSMVRQPTAGSNNGSNQGSVSAVQRIQRLRINSNNKIRPLQSSDGFKSQQSGSHVHQNLPRVSNQKLQIGNNRSLSSSGQKILNGTVGAVVSNTQIIKNKIKINKAGARDNSYTSQNSSYQVSQGQKNINFKNQADNYKLSGNMMQLNIPESGQHSSQKPSIRNRSNSKGFQSLDAGQQLSLQQQMFYQQNVNIQRQGSNGPKPSLNPKVGQVQQNK